MAALETESGKAAIVATLEGESGMAAIVSTHEAEIDGKEFPVARTTKTEALVHAVGATLDRDVCPVLV